MKVSLADVCSRREKVKSGSYKIIVTLPEYDELYYAVKGITGWWLHNSKDSPITKVRTLLDAELKAEEISANKVNSL